MVLDLKTGTITICHERIDISPKSVDEVVAFMQKQIGLKTCCFDEVDWLARSILQTTNALQESLGNSTPNLQELCYYRLCENEVSKIFYQYFRERYPQSPSIYMIVDTAANRVYSNCDLLTMKLILLQGIAKAEIESETIEYKNYLIAAEAYESLRSQE